LVVSLLEVSIQSTIPAVTFVTTSTPVQIATRQNMLIVP